MCGITGILGDTFVRERRTEILRDMNDSLEHRGPDDSGVWSDPSVSVSLGHRRLSILDLSEAGHQPMISASGRMVIAFNGEIYNFGEIRSSLESRGVTFHGRSDTEVLLESIERDGLTSTLSRCRGMFAFALWDRHEKVFHLARDRFGEKPLYIGKAGGDFIFGSELRAFRIHPSFEREIDPAAAADFVRLGHIPVPRSVYKNARKLPAGTALSVSLHGLSRFESIDDLLGLARPYWSITDLINSDRAGGGVVSESSEIDKVESALARAVQEQLVSDVPVGAFLSGGIDSSLITALMRNVAGQAVRTFTIGFADQRYDESDNAAAVAKHLGTRHTTLKVSAQDALDVIPRLPLIYDEPFADSSQIPTALVCQLAKGDVTVALSGDGGDEVFGGYNRHVWGPILWRRLSMFPRWARSGLAWAINSGDAKTWSRVLRFVQTVQRSSIRHRLPTEKLFKLATILPADSPETLYKALTRQAGCYRVLRPSLHSPPKPCADSFAFSLGGLTFAEQMMVADSQGYLQNDILVKVDRAAMSVGLETRAPFLDERVVRAAWSLPLDLKVRGDTGKYVLKKVLARHVPAALTDRPKIGFGVPIDEWLRGPLKDWAYSLLTPERIAQCEFLSADETAKVLREHMTGQRDWHHILWALLMWQSWLDQERAPHG